MKTKSILLALLTFLVNNLFAQNNQNEPSFSELYIKTADLIIEGTVTSVSYFKDTSEAIRKYKIKSENYSEDFEQNKYFVKYEIMVHKIFKGSYTEKITLITENCNGYVYIDNKLITELRHSYAVKGPIKSNMYVGYTSTFFLKKTYLNGVKFHEDAFFPNNDFMGTYEQNYASLFSFGICVYGKNRKTIPINELNDLYKYLEKETGNKKIDITHKVFVLINTTEKRDIFINKFNLYSVFGVSIWQKIRSGSINQFNIDSFKVPPIYQPTKKELRILKRERIRKGEEAKIKSKKMLEKMKEDLNYYKKTGSLNKVDETLTYTFSNAFYRKALQELMSIVPVMLYDAKLSQDFASRLLEEGIYVIGFYYPVVPKGQARIRVQISAGHDRAHLDKAIAAFTKVGKELGVIK